MRRRLAFLAFAWVLLGTGAARGAEVSVAVAANFAGTMQKIAPAFEQATGHRAVVAIGSTGRFYAQIRNGAPFHVLLSADDETPARLEREGRAVPGTRFTYALGRLVLWSRQAGLVDGQGEVLRSGRIERLALADPRLAPYGAASVQVMERLGVLERLRPRLVQGESIGQAFQFVASGNVPVGFVALSQLRAGAAPAGGSHWVVPEALHEPLRQDAVVLEAGRDNPAAQALMRFLRSDEARAIIGAQGYAF
ncbi:molybdate ABC transporter substrate-binding protein [Ramlibacter rhizophilus]|uniref:Molybdate ABC transporter substrate-binding protein n=1 Tax=Ramlibacter rhizophilus TaxID=1781167 RepID=A0A4Z0BE39_9BURK|nr:molybdate ABC transporter substrate-binding protein [Ramlibacter rhizophilus]TFY96384.1 molybdate ABC transporter substrate-binding protein [Ramlibacter rhizophilus]